MESLKKSLIVVAALGIAVLGVNLQATSAHKSNISLANLNALKSTSNNFECPSVYDVPYAYIDNEVKTYKVKCKQNRVVEIDGFNITGDFSENDEYTLVVEIFKCKTDNDRMSCCDVDKQRAVVLNNEQ